MMMLRLLNNKHFAYSLKTKRSSQHRIISINGEISDLVQKEEMMNKYIYINRIEFSITNACTSRCKHCSVGNTLSSDKSSVDREKAMSVISELAKLYPIESVMTFGGEPFYMPILSVQSTRQQLITGYIKGKSSLMDTFLKISKKLLQLQKH